MATLQLVSTVGIEKFPYGKLARWSIKGPVQARLVTNLSAQRVWLHWPISSSNIIISPRDPLPKLVA